MTRFRLLLLGICSLFLFPMTTQAWNDAGHMTIARIAWDFLSTDERASINSILRQHPHLDSLLRQGQPEGVPAEEWVFLRSAVWADYVRPPKSFPREEIANHPLHKYHRGNWHYINFAYEPRNAKSGMPEKPLPEETNLLKQLDLTMRILNRETKEDPGRISGLTDEQNRAVRMTWLFHLLGDLHQPLHTIALIEPQSFPDPPHSDQGGNKLAIRASETAMPKNLHWLWDEMFSTESQFPQICHNAERLTHDPALRPDQLPELGQNLTFEAWAAESYEGAITHAYQNGQLKRVLWDDLNQGRIRDTDVPTLEASAWKSSREYAQRRVLVAGHRLAQKLREIAKK